MTEKLFGLRLIANNALPISLQAGEILAELGGQAALGLVDYGLARGEVLILSDLGSLDLHDSRHHERDNLAFLRNLARYARQRLCPACGGLLVPGCFKRPNPGLPSG